MPFLVDPSSMGLGASSSSSEGAGDSEDSDESSEESSSADMLDSWLQSTSADCDCGCGREGVERGRFGLWGRER